MVVAARFLADDAAAATSSIHERIRLFWGQLSKWQVASAMNEDRYLQKVALRPGRQWGCCSDTGWHDASRSQAM